MHDSNHRAAILARIAKVTPNSPRQWGKMNSAQALWHTAQPYRQATGEIEVKPAGPAILRVGLVRWLVVHCLPLPKGAPTAAEYVAPSQVDFDKAKRELAAAIEAFQKHSGDYKPNAALGPMPREDWGLLMWKHTDHHLRQFGC